MAGDLRERYLEQGFLHIEGVFDAEQVADALDALEEVPDWVRGASHRDIQRAQPLQMCPAARGRGWLKRFYGNAKLEEIIGELFDGVIAPTPSMAHDFKLTGLLIEPLGEWWSTGLHRDYRDFIKGLDVEAWQAQTRDLRLFNQISVPLLEDGCFWAVPGSHRRGDTAREAEMVAGRMRYRCRGGGAAPEGGTGPLREKLLADLAECGAVNPQCGPGDFLIYRSNMLHCGMYEPRVKRMTLHDAVYSAQWRDFVLNAAGVARAAAG